MAKKYRYEATIVGKKIGGGTYNSRASFVGLDSTFDSGGNSKELNSKALAAVKRSNLGIMEQNQYKTIEVLGFVKREAIEGESNNKSETKTSSSGQGGGIFSLIFSLFKGIWWIVKKILGIFFKN